MGSIMTWSTFPSLASASGTKINFKDMAVEEFEDAEEKFIAKLDGWLNYQSLIDAVKTVFPDMSSLSIQTKSYNELVTSLIVYLPLKDAKSEFFDVAVNKHTMSASILARQLNKLSEVVDVLKKFLKLIHDILVNPTKSVLSIWIMRLVLRTWSLELR